ncbi:MAG: ABC transporter ATP-binding protein [Methylobacter sp.]
MFIRLIENFLNPIAPPGKKAASLFGVSVPDMSPLPSIWKFYWYFLNQAKLLFIAIFIVGFTMTVIDIIIPIIIGHLLNFFLIYSPQSLWIETWPDLLSMGCLVLIVRPLMGFMHNVLVNQGINANFTSLIRWQSHWHVMRQGLPFFQENLSGRIASRVMQVGPVLRESVIRIISTTWYVLVFCGFGIGFLASANWFLAVPVVLWFCLNIVIMRFMLPNLYENSRLANERQSLLTGRIVDVYANIQTVKLFARVMDEDAAICDAHSRLNKAVRFQMWATTVSGLLLSSLNAAMLTGTVTIAIWLWTKGAVSFQTIAAALPMVWQITNTSGVITSNIAAIFDNIGVVKEAMNSIAVPHTAPDSPLTNPLKVIQGEIRFEAVSFGYGQELDVIQKLDLLIKPGERVGLIGPSGAGKSTLVNLLLAMFRPEVGRILVDEQDISTVTQESLRATISVVSQDTALFHRSIRENIAYGLPHASMADIIEAAKRAHAHDFICEQVDCMGRVGYEAHVGERGAKLSGGQRQRIAIARVFLKNAPILVLDEATNALDSEVEANIQEQLSALMDGKTVIAIAHRLSTIVRMDRLLVLDKGKIVEQGSHTELLNKGGMYASLWKRQSSDFLIP